MCKKVVFTLLSIIIIGLTILRGFTNVYNLVEYMDITRLVPVIVVLLFVIGLIKFLKKKSGTMLLLSFIYIISLILSNSISTQIIDNEYKVIFRSGERIGSALDQYYKDNKHYPRDMNELVPKYINTIPKINATWEHCDSNLNFSYDVIEFGNNYELRYAQYSYDGKGWYQEE